MKKLILLSCTIILSACSSTQADRESKAIGMPNPASAYCVKQGGKLEIVKTDTGEVGYCNLPNGERVEEWALFRKSNPQ